MGSLESVPVPEPSVTKVDLVLDLDVPMECSGIPVFRVDGEEIVFLAHILSRVLYCHCRTSRHFGLFRDKKFSQYRRMIDTSGWRIDLHYDPKYENKKEDYSLLRLKDSSVALTLEGLNKWCATSKCERFRAREENKCKKDGCVKNRCTCKKN